MPINRLILEIDDQSMTENFVTFNMIDFHRLSSSTIDFHRLSSYPALPFEDCVYLYRDILGIPMYAARCQCQSIAIDGNRWQSM